MTPRAAARSCSGRTVLRSSAPVRAKSRRMLLGLLLLLRLAGATIRCASVSFSKRVITATANGAHSDYALDVDGDGDVDALSGSYRDDTVAWYENDGSQSFAENVLTNSANGANLGRFDRGAELRMVRRRRTPGRHERYFDRGRGGAGRRNPRLLRERLVDRRKIRVGVGDVPARCFGPAFGAHRGVYRKRLGDGSGARFVDVARRLARNGCSFDARRSGRLSAGPQLVLVDRVPRWERRAKAPTYNRVILRVDDRPREGASHGPLRADGDRGLGGCPATEPRPRPRRKFPRRRRHIRVPADCILG